MDHIATALKVLGHTERLRILALLSRGELTVSELVQILKLSQPRITQYIKSLEDAGIIERLKEGSWVFSRLSRSNAAISALVATALAALPAGDPVLLADSRRLNDVRKDRAKIVDNFFANVANDRGQLGDEYLPRESIETHMRDLAGEGPFDYMVDLGTGTGRVLEIFEDRIKRGSGIDNNSGMLKVARHNLSGQGRGHITVRQGDLNATPLQAGLADIVTLHQVLHYLEEPQTAIAEAARLLDDNGIILIVDFMPHDHEDFRTKYAHRRLGFSDQDIEGWMNGAAMDLVETRQVESQNALPSVKIWLGRKQKKDARKVI